MPEKPKTLAEIRKDEEKKLDLEFDRKYDSKRIEYLEKISKKLSSLARGVEKEILKETRAGKSCIEIELGDIYLPFISSSKERGRIFQKGYRSKKMDVGAEELKNTEGFQKLSETIETLRGKYDSKIEISLKEMDKLSSSGGGPHDGFYITPEQFKKLPVYEFSDSTKYVFGDSGYYHSGSVNLLKITF